MSTGPSLTDPAMLADPRTGFGRVREEGPVVRGTSIAGTPAWYVTRHDDVRAVLGDPRFVTSPGAAPGAVEDRDRMLEQFGIPRDLFPYMTTSILDVDGADHVRLRKLVSRAFTVRRIAGLRTRVAEIAAELLDALAGRTGAVDLIAGYAHPLPITVICELVGVPEADRAAWRGIDAAVTSTDPVAMGAVLREVVASTHRLIDQRRAAPADDLVTDLIRAQDEDGSRLSDVEMVTMVLGLVSAGHQTTAHLVGNGTLALLEHPDQLALLRRDPGLWPSAVTELMRWCGPVQIAQLRHATQNVTIAGVPVRAGDAVQVVLVAANHDPRHYGDPERLDVRRRPPGRGEGHLGFGHGAHYCLGAALARQEGEVALSALFERFPAMTTTADPVWAPVPGMRQLAALPVLLAP